MLKDVLKSIRNPISRANLGYVLHNLIKPGCGNVPVRILIEPYNLLPPILNKYYTLKFIRNLDKEEYAPDMIAGILCNIYRYSYVSDDAVVASVQTQPYVTLERKTDGHFILSYETYNSFPVGITYVNELRFLTLPLEFVERKCIKTPSDHTSSDIACNFFSFDKCDQYIAFQQLIKTNRTAQQELSGPSTSKAGKLKTTQFNRNTPSGSIMSVRYLEGYICYGLIEASGTYTFSNT